MPRQPISALARRWIRPLTGSTALSDILAYHEATKHSPQSVAGGGQRLDWSIKPLPFKIYRGLTSVEPPEDVARLCLFSNGVLRWSRYGGESYGFRAAPCTGALYHVELYLATAERKGLPAGLYHYGAHDGRLGLLREGDVRGVIHRATGEHQPIAHAPLAFVLTSTFWRNAWKYGPRAYRHAYWDGGAVVANLLALLAVDRAPGSVAIEFADDEVNQLIGIDGEREAAIALVAAGEGAAEPRPISDVASVSAETQPLSPREVHYPEIEQAHRVSSLANGEQAAATRARSGEHGQAMPAVVTQGPIEDVIRRRRSARRFGPRPISLAELDKLLEAAMQPIPGDSFSPLPVEPYLIVNAVDGLARGAYDRQLRLIRRGDFRQTAADLALWQELAGEAGANVYLLADLESLIGQLGQRGYRVAQLAGGICGGRIELAATDLGLAATGLTFFDDSVSRFFEPAAARRQVIYLAAIGSR